MKRVICIATKDSTCRSEQSRYNSSDKGLHPREKGYWVFAPVFSAELVALGSLWNWIITQLNGGKAQGHYGAITYFEQLLVSLL